MSASSKKRLSEMKIGEVGTILSIDAPVEWTQRLLAMGLVEGSTVRLAHEAPFGGDAIAVQVRGGLIALRRDEATEIWVRS